MRQCLHDWQDSQCNVILDRLKDAMTRNYSRLLIHESIIPEKNSSIKHVTNDLIMMSMFAAQERTESHWKSLLHASGFSITQIWHPSDGISEGVIEAELAG